MKIGVIGTGGVGGYFGARLAESGNVVKFIARGKHLQAIKENGLKLKSIKGDLHLNQPIVSDNISDLSDCELIIIGTKAWQIKEVAKILSESLNKDALILPLQNGVLAIDELKLFFDENQILGGLCMIFSSIESPGVINHKGLEPSITFGEIDSTVKVRTLRIKKTFEKAGFNTNLSDDIVAALWKKFILICLSGLGALLNSGYGLIRETPETRKIIIAVLTEVALIAKVKKVDLPKNIVEKSLSIVDTYPKDSISSLARDVLSGKPTEIEYQNGTIVRLGKELGIETPTNEFIYGAIKFLEKKNIR